MKTVSCFPDIAILVQHDFDSVTAKPGGSSLSIARSAHHLMLNNLMPCLYHRQEYAPRRMPWHLILDAKKNLPDLIGDPDHWYADTIAPQTPL